MFRKRSVITSLSYSIIIVKQVLKVLFFGGIGLVNGKKNPELTSDTTSLKNKNS